MARVTPRPGRGAGVRAWMVFWFTERAPGRLAGRRDVTPRPRHIRRVGIRYTDDGRNRPMRQEGNYVTHRDHHRDRPPPGRGLRICQDRKSVV